jgi:sterol desaturase/sphingolipid hydroxylase (fatty acid hydroxylase superfamily)
METVMEIATFVALVLLFECAERLLPARSVNRLAEIRTDVLSFLAALLLNRLAVTAIDGWLLPSDLAALPGWMTFLHSLHSVPKILLGMVLVDLAIYWLHRAQHARPALWRTHVWHHSIRELYWFSGFRTSLLHSFLNNIPQVAIPAILLGATPIETGIGYAIGLFIQFWEHSNVRVEIGPLRYVFVTPDLHRIHHAAAPDQTRNFGNIFTIWDQMFGTYLDPKHAPKSFALGLGRLVKVRELPRLLIGI